MSTLLENLEEIEALYLLYKYDNNLVSELLTKLQSYEGLPEYTQYVSLITLLKMSLTKQQLENNNYASDRWQSHAYFTEISGKRKKNAHQNALRHLLSIGVNNIEIGKIFQVSRYTIIRLINNHNLKDILIEPEDDSVIENYPQEIISTYKNIDELYTCGVLLSKGIKIRRQRLRTILRCLKSS